MRLRTDKRYGRGIVSQYQLHRASVAGGGTGYSPPSKDVANILIHVADWADDDGSGSPVTPTYTDAPNIGTIKYVDVAHNLLSDTAFAVGYIDTTAGKWYMAFIDQTPISDATLRVWLAGTPANDVYIKVLA